MSTTLTERIDLLFKTFLRKDGKEFSYHDVEVDTGKAITAPYVWKLRTGKAKNPGYRVLKALSAFFGVPITYFFDDSASEEDVEDLRLAKEMKGTDVAQIAMRSSDLDREGKQAILEMINYVRRAQGLNGR